MSSCDLCGAERSEHFAQKHELTYLQCPECEFIYSDTTDFDFEAHNEEIIEDLRDTHVGKIENPRHVKAYARLLKHFDQYRQEGGFLEIGCSTGSFLSYVKESGWQEIGVEPVESSARYGIDHLGLNIHIGTMDTLEVKPGSVDVVYSNAVVEHLEHPSRVIAQAFDILRPGGLLYADTVNMDSYTWRFLGPRWKMFDPRMHLSLFTPQTLAAVCTNAGFRVKKIETHGVRFHANRAERPKGARRILDELRKAPYSWAARHTLKGDNIAIYAEKPA